MYLRRLAWVPSGYRCIAIFTLAAVQSILGYATADSILPEITVTGDWLGSPIENVAKTYPSARTVVEEEDIHESGARTVEDALRLVPGVRTMDENAVGTLPNIGIRGLNPLRSQQALVLVDGVPAALAPYGQLGLSLFPITLEMLAAIDVARGGVVVRYGPNNAGGVINFITKPIPREPGFTAKESLRFSEGNLLTDTYLRAGGFVRDNLGLQVQADVVEGDTFHNSDRDFTFGFPLTAGQPAASVRSALRHFEVVGSEPRYSWLIGGGLLQQVTVGVRYII